MSATHGRKLLNGDIANLSIGQGDTLVTPLQMAQAMAIVANGGTFYQTRLVQQVQSIDGGIVTAYNIREKRALNLSETTIAQLRTGMINAVNGPAGTAHAASLDNVEVAGKTGTAQWGPKNKERTAAWFAGYLPADNPKYAFAALYEGDVGVKAHGGTVAAPLIAQIFKDVYSKGEMVANGRRKRRAAPARNSLNLKSGARCRSRRKIPATDRGLLINLSRRSFPPALRHPCNRSQLRKSVSCIRAPCCSRSFFHRPARDCK